MTTRKRFYYYVIPSICSFVLLGIYCFIDEFFVGNRVGDVGIAAINIAFSYIAVFGALGSGLGIGASVSYSITKGAESEEKAVGYLGISNWLMLGCSLLASLPLLLFPRRILLLLGASETISKIAVSYMQISALGGLPMVFAAGLTPIVRNLGGSVLSMAANVFGILINILFDWIFVWILGWGLAGAALASIVGQIAAFLILLVYLLSHHSFHWGKGSLKTGDASKRIINIGISPFGLTMAPNLSIVFMNRACLLYGGDKALACYGVISYLTYIVLLTMQGVGEGSQPLVSEYFGLNQTKERRLVENMAFRMCFVLAAFAMVLTWFAKRRMGIFMGTSEEVGLMIARTLPIFMLAFPFSAYARIKASNLFSKEKNMKAYVITYLDPVLVILGTLVFPLFLGEFGVWFSSTFAQIVIALVALFLV